MSFKKATKQQARLRLGIHGPSGAGKTYSALSIAEHLGKKVALIDSERGSASKYSDRFNFDTCIMEGNHHPDLYIKAIEEAGKEGYDVIVIDSLTHAWNGKGGFLELVEDAKKRGKGDGFTAWRALTPVYQRLVDTILSSPAHVIVTLRAKTDYVMERNDAGKTNIKKQGLAPEMRDSFQYEMDVEGMLNLDHELVIGKTRCPGLDGRVFLKPGREFADIVLPWLTDGAPASPPPIVQPISNTELPRIRGLIAAATSKDMLTVVSQEAQAAFKDGRITMEEYKSLTPEYKAKMDTL